jgi:hypothetical protein
MMKSWFTIPAVVLTLSLSLQQVPGTRNGAEPDVLARRYREGQTLSYQMKATNEERGKKLAYEIQAEGVVKKNDDGFVEEFAWSHLVVNGAPMSLSPGSQAFRQMLSMEPNRKMGLPDLSKVDPILIGPITDTLTFYADILIAHTQGRLAHVNDHFDYKNGVPASWADGRYVILGQSSIDFDVTLTAIDGARRYAVVTVKHVPPQTTQVKLPAEWMKPPVADTANNWVQVIQQGEGKYVASVGKETFLAEIKLSLDDGRMLSATLDNPVEVRERQCTDAALTQCGESERYSILRRINVTSRE